MSEFYSNFIVTWQMLARVEEQTGITFRDIYRLFPYIDDVLEERIRSLYPELQYLFIGVLTDTFDPDAFVTHYVEEEEEEQIEEVEDAYLEEEEDESETFDEYSSDEEEDLLNVFDDSDDEDLIALRLETSKEHTTIAM